MTKDQKRNIIYFGEYPQTIKADDVEITDIKDERGYFLGSDGNYYAKVISKPYYCLWCDRNSTQKEKREFQEIVGDHFYPILRGHTSDCKFKLLPINTIDKYRFSNNSQILPREEYYFKVEKIEWEVLEFNAESSLLLSSKVLDSSEYSDSSSNYKESYIRNWLINYFFNDAFDASEQDAILETTINNSVATTNKGNPSCCSRSTLDKVFLLSFADTNNISYGYNESSNCVNENLIKDTTDFGRATGVMINGGLYGACAEWWLRSAKESQVVSIVNFNGASNNLGFVSKKCYGVVPAIVIDSAKQLEIESAKKDTEIEKLKKKAANRLKELKKNAKSPTNEKEESSNDEIVVPHRKNRVFTQRTGYNGRLRYDAGVPSHDYTEGSKMPSYSAVYDEENAYYDASDEFDDINEYSNGVPEDK